jgi:hypothetical protein
MRAYDHNARAPVGHSSEPPGGCAGEWQPLAAWIQGDRGGRAEIRRRTAVHAGEDYVRPAVRVEVGHRDLLGEQIVADGQTGACDEVEPAAAVTPEQAEAPAVRLSFDIPTTDDPMYPMGHPRHGDRFSVDASDYDPLMGVAAADLTFNYDTGPSMRRVSDLSSSTTIVNACRADRTGAIAAPRTSRTRRRTTGSRT